jgi:Domain of unknown function (DUF4184)
LPFTLSHPAAILPLRRLKPLRTVPLLLGALAPDFSHYLPTSVRTWFPYTHSFAASWRVCLPLCLGIIACCYLLRAPLTALMSPRARWLCLSAIEPFGKHPVEWLLAPLSILLGAWSHLLWDSFTHGNGWMVRHYAALHAQFTIGSYFTTVNRVLQYLSSVAGLAILALWYWRLPAPDPLALHARTGRPPAGPVLLLCAAAATLIGGVQATSSLERIPSVYLGLETFFTHGLAWFAVLYLVAGTVLTLEHQGDGSD